MTPIALVFDAYGTLFDVHAVVQRCESYWPGKGAQLSQLWRTKQLEWTWQRSLMAHYLPFDRLTVDALEYACEALGLPLDQTRRDVLMADYRCLGVFLDARNALARLRAARMPLAILTNGSPDMIVPLVEYRGLTRFFTAVLSADELRVYKPAPQVYELAAQRLAVAPEAIGFVSSNCWDALGAKAYGFNSWWINRAGAPMDRLDLQPDGVLTGLGELPARLGL